MLVTLVNSSMSWNDARKIIGPKKWITSTDHYITLDNEIKSTDSETELCLWSNLNRIQDKA